MWKNLGFYASGIVLLSLLVSHAWADITEFDLPNPSSAPGRIIIDPDGHLWFGE
jgi:hypothetical protein